MKKFLARLLMVVLCVPYLACAMPVCDQHSVELSAQTDICVEHVQSVEHQQHEMTQAMLLLDCAGIDFLFMQPDLQSQKVESKQSDHLVALMDDFLFNPHPFKEVALKSLSHSAATLPPNIILTTQRFRL